MILFIKKVLFKLEQRIFSCKRGIHNFDIAYKNIYEVHPLSKQIYTRTLHLCKTKNCNASYYSYSKEYVYGEDL